MSASPWTPTIGLEIHARLKTRTKAFCRCEVSFAAEANTRTCPVCLGWPGSLPVLNEEAVRLAIRAALALRAKVATRSVFDRKNYFYPDLPKGYQITQADHPLATAGRVDIHSAARGELSVGIARIHMEEDAGRTTHDDDGHSRLDFNRAGAPLVEIVTEPVLRSSDEAIACFSRIRQMLMWAGSCDGNMEEGSLRCDANVSVSRTDTPGTRTETKNLNSFRFVGKAIEYEISRQIELLESGTPVRQETRLYDVASGTTRSMRSKEEAHDYRFFPDPDLHPLVLSAGQIAHEASTLPEMPDSRARRYRAVTGMDPLESEAIAGARSISELFEELAARVGDDRLARNWILNHVLRAMNERPELESPQITITQLEELISLTREGVISSTVAREVFDSVWGTAHSPQVWVAEKGLAQTRDDEAIRAMVARLMADHPDEVAAYRGGRGRLLGFFVGLVMKETAGKADPRLTSQLVKEMLDTE